METEHIVGIGMALVISVIIVWIVWSFFCGDSSSSSSHKDSKGDPGDDSDAGGSDTYSSTHVITSIRKKPPRTRQKQPSMSSNSEGSSDDDLKRHDLEEGHKPRRTKQPSKKRRSSYQFTANKYGLDDPFAEWQPKDSSRAKDSGHSVITVYPKSPVLKHAPHKKSDIVVDI